MAVKIGRRMQTSQIIGYLDSFAIFYRCAARLGSCPIRRDAKSQIPNSKSQKNLKIPKQTKTRKERFARPASPIRVARRRRLGFLFLSAFVCVFCLLFRLLLVCFIWDLEF